MEARMSLGFLYQDFKSNFYYWEIVKILMKFYVVAMHNIFIEYKIFSSTLIMNIFIIYLIISLMLNPIKY
jgi:hypothetical protein